MGIAKNNESNVGAPAWYTEKEASCFEEVKALARSIGSAKCICVENIYNEELMEETEEPEYLQHNQVLVECTKELSDEDILRIRDFNTESRPLLVSFCYESECVEGKRYGY